MTTLRMMIVGTLLVGPTATRPTLASSAQASDGLEAARSAITAFARSNYEEAAKRARAALDLLETQDLAPVEKEAMRAYILGVLGLSYDALGLPARAAETFSESQRHAAQSGLPAVQGLADVFAITLRARHDPSTVATIPDLEAQFRQQTGRAMTAQESALNALLSASIQSNIKADGWDPAQPPPTPELLTYPFSQMSG